VYGQQCDDICAPSTRKIECGDGLAFWAPRQIRVEITPDDISSSRLHVGPTYCRSFQFVCNNPPTFLQQQIFRFTNLWCRRVSTKKLGVTQQLCESSLSTHSVLQVIQNQNANTTVIAPWWPAQPWFQTLKKLSVTSPVRLPAPQLICLRITLCQNQCGIGSGVYSLGGFLEG